MKSISRGFLIGFINFQLSSKLITERSAEHKIKAVRAIFAIRKKSEGWQLYSTKDLNNLILKFRKSNSKFSLLEVSRFSFSLKTTFKAYLKFRSTHPAVSKIDPVSGKLISGSIIEVM
jgi:hypothetical protein